MGEDPGHLNPGITTGFNVHAIAGSIFNGLVELDDNATPIPDLADSWTVNDDATQYTFDLADGVTWHDGEPFTSGDVKFTFENILLNFHSRTKGGLENILASIETPDDNTVVFNFSAPYSALLQRLNSTEAPILAEHIYAGSADVQTDPANLTPVGTGPFMFESYAPNDQVRLVANPNYFKAGLPKLDGVVFRIIPDATTQLAALEQGEVDFIWRVPGPDVSRLEGSSDVTLYKVNSGPGGGFCIPTLTFNLDRDVFSDVRVRQAIAHAVNRQQIVDQAIFGQGRVATGPFNSQLTSVYTDDVTNYEYDVATAAGLLDEAGLAAGDDGIRASITLMLFPNFVNYGEIIKENLADVGIEVELVALERSAFLPRVFGERDFDTNIISYCNNTDPSIGISRMYLSSNIGDIPFSNGAGYVNPMIDSLFDEAVSQSSEAERAATYAEVQQILTEDMPYLWLVETEFVAASGANVSGLAPWSGHLVEAASIGS
ncbi:MAG: ABC transporter substrate-binding protein [Acidimicrobiia bacterium]|nr:ABC transporter substrate-binding protein [Acidimicrobiia bacterium]